MVKAHTILAVDDEAFNLDIITYHLQQQGYDVQTAQDGIEALEKLRLNHDISAIVLDRMMPRMDGMEVLAIIKGDERLKNLPVIMQTAAAANEQVLEGIRAGVYYYLTKPYDESMLLTLVSAAIKDREIRRKLHGEMEQWHRVFGLLDRGIFRFQTLADAKDLALYAAACFPDPGAVVCGLSELLVNAVEHGNLGISYQQKKALMMAGTWEEEIARRLSLPEYCDAYATLCLSIDETAIRLSIKDQGQGFDWKHYLEISPHRATDPNGRGIALARELCFPEIHYVGSGNEVVCTVPHAGLNQAAIKPIL